VTCTIDSREPAPKASVAEPSCKVWVWESKPRTLLLVTQQRRPCYGRLHHCTSSLCYYVVKLPSRDLYVVLVAQVPPASSFLPPVFCLQFSQKDVGFLRPASSTTITNKLLAAVAVVVAVLLGMQHSMYGNMRAFMFAFSGGANPDFSVGAPERVNVSSAKCSSMPARPPCGRSLSSRKSHQPHRVLCHFFRPGKSGSLH